MLSEIQIVNNSTAIRYLNCLVYKCIEEYLSNLDNSVNKINRKYNMLTKHIASEYSKYVISGWLFCLKIIDMINNILINYDEIYSNLIYKKVSNNPRLTFSMKIDAVVRRKQDKEIDIICLVPNIPGNITITGVSSIDTMFALEYLRESKMQIGNIHEIRYNLYEEYLNLNTSRITPSINRYQKQVCESIDNNFINPLRCSNCIYRNNCTIKNRLR